MDADGSVERRRIAILDGDRRYDLALPAHATLDVVLAGIGLPLVDGQRVLVDRGGAEVSPSAQAADLIDGVLLSVIDPTAAPPAPPQTAGRAAGNDRTPAAAAWWLVGGAAVLLCLLAVLLPNALDAPLRFGLAVLAGVGAAASATVWARRTVVHRPGSVAVVGAPLVLAFAAGVVAIPPLPAATAPLAVFTGLVCAAVLAALLGLIARAAVIRAEMGTVTLVLLVLSAVWGLAVLLDLPVSAPAAVSLGAVPVALRALPSTLLDVPPGMFLDYRRLQRSRWTVRQKLPDDGEPIGATAARDLVDRSSGRLVVGTAMLSVIAASAAWFAIPAFDAVDPIVLGGRIALATCTALALVLGARRASAPLLRWMPRIAAAVVIAVSAIALVRALGSQPLLIVAGLLLAAGVAAAFVVVPVGRGARSLAWSRFADVIEWIAVVLSLPAGLLAADVIDLLRGMMGG